MLGFMVYHGLTWLNYDDLSWPTMIFPTIGINSGDCICSASNLPVFEVYLHFWTNAKGNFHRNSWLDPRFKHSPFLYIKPSVFFYDISDVSIPQMCCWNMLKPSIREAASANNRRWRPARLGTPCWRAWLGALPMPCWVEALPLWKNRWK